MSIGNPILVGDDFSTRVLTIIANANQTLFNIPGGYKVNQIGVYRNSIKLIDGKDYVARNGTSVTLTNGATNGDALEFEIFDDFRVPDAIVSKESEQTLFGDLTIDGQLSVNPDIFVAGVVTATAFYGDGSNLTNVSVDSGDWGIHEFIASGSISSGDAVVINSDGTVSVISGTGSKTPTAGTSRSFFLDKLDIASTYDSTNGKVIVAYRDDNNSSYGTAIVGTVSGTNITFGAATVFNSNAVSVISAAYDSTNERVVISHREDVNSKGKAVVGTVTGTGITFGQPNTFTSGTLINNTVNTTTLFDPSTDKVVIAYNESSIGSGEAVVGTVTGDTIGFGTTATFNSANVNYITSTYDSTNDKVVVAYQDEGNSNYGTAIVGTVTGTGITFGTPIIFNNAGTTWCSAIYDSANNKVGIAYSNFSSGYGEIILGSISGDTIGFGTAGVWEYGGNISYISSTYGSNNGRVTIAYRDEGNTNRGKVLDGYVNGTSINFSPPIQFRTTDDVDYISSSYDSSNNKVVLAFRNNTDGVGNAVVISPTDFATNLTEDNYVGIASGAISDTATGKVTICSNVNVNQTGLTTARIYYINPQSGDLQLTVPIESTYSYIPNIPIVIAGLSISSTEIIVR